MWQYILTAQTTGVLQLQTAFLVEPVLQAYGEVCLIPSVNLGVTIVGLTAGHHVEGVNYGDAGGDITTTASYLTVLTAQPLSTNAGRTGFLVRNRRLVPMRLFLSCS